MTTSTASWAESGREDGAEYGADPSLVFVSGSAAGGHLVTFAALTPNDPAFKPRFERADTSVAGAICLYGCYGSLDGHDLAPSSPQAYVRRDSPPLFVAHGDLEMIVIVEDARAFVERLLSTSSAPVVYTEPPGAYHRFDLFHSIHSDTVVAGIEAFTTFEMSRGTARAV